MKAEIKELKELLEGVSAPRFFEFQMPSGKELFLLILGLVVITFPLWYAPLTPEFSAEVGLGDLNFYLFLLLLWVIPIHKAFPSKIQGVMRELSNKNIEPQVVHFNQGSGGRATEPSTATKKEGWLFSPPQIDDWHPESPYKEDAAGLLADHPNNIGTPVPSTISMEMVVRMVGTVSIIMFSMTILRELSNLIAIGEAERESTVYAVISYMGLIAIFMLAGAFMEWKKIKTWRQTMDLPTSRIRSMAVGDVEVYGQLRPRIGWPSVVYVDGDIEKSAHGMAQWGWSYNQVSYWEEFVVKTDSEGNTTRTWEDRSRTVFVRGDAGFHQSMVHDGTGGCSIDHGLLEHHGSSLKRDWKRPDNSIYSGPRGMNIRSERAEHVWDLKGWSYGEPMFIHGVAESRPRAELEEEGVDMTIAPALIEIKNKKGVSFKPNVYRGTELLSLHDLKSPISALTPNLVTAVAMILMLLTFVM
ncbi:MAG: hypothetical protein VW230_06150 [Candidatus Poseidoniales archaeon]